MIFLKVFARESSKSSSFLAICRYFAIFKTLSRKMSEIGQYVNEAEKEVLIVVHTKFLGHLKLLC